ncbi:MAG TPA: ferredoxin--NADP(+) reductase [Actinobacteria bacterium]|nr:ferredoxin--NADP(+) reductase [Actinomycetota bacterium]
MTETASQAAEVDLLVIGAGPAGLFATYYAGFRTMRVALMDSLPALGGQVSALYPEKMIFDVAGFPAVKGQRLVDDLVEQAMKSQPEIYLGHRAEELVEDADGVTVTTHRGATVRAKAVIITGGIGTFSPRPLPDAEAYEGKGLRYFVPKLDELADKDVLIVGGGDSALDWAMALEPLATSVTLIHRRTSFRGHEATVEQLMASSCSVLTPFEVKRINGGDQIESVEIFNNDTQEERTLSVQAVVAALGFTADLGPFTRWGLDLEKKHILVDTTMRTNLQRVFAAGDVVEYPGKVRLIAVGFGEAATAVNNAAGVITPGAKVFPGHSSGG